MKRLLIALLLLAAIAGGALMWLRGPLGETRDAALAAYPVYALVRTEQETRVRNPAQGLAHSDRLSGPRDRWVTTPNNDTLYSSAFLDLSAGPYELVLPGLPGRYHSVALMDARTDNVFVLRTDGAGETVRIAFGDGKAGRVPPAGDGAVATYHMPTRQAWLLVRVLVDGPADLAAARAAQRSFILTGPEAADRPPALLLPVTPDPAALLRRANPVIAANAHLARPELAATGYGGDAEAFDALPAWRQWLWRLVLPRMFEKLRESIAAGARATDDGWSRSPPGIGTAQASPEVRAAVALAGLGALPVSEAVYWSAVQDKAGEELDGSRRYSLRIAPGVPVEAFWSLSLYERLPDGRLFYVANPVQRYAVGDRTPGLIREADGSLLLTLSASDPGEGANWLPTPAKGPFTLIFRGYRPAPAMAEGRWRLPPVERLAP
jgi:hypothetical protein